MVIATQLPEDMSNNEIYPALVHFKNLVEARTDGDLEVRSSAAASWALVKTALKCRAGARCNHDYVSRGVSSFYEDYQVVTAPFLTPTGVRH